MATIGSIQEFDVETESVSAYLERVQLFMVANAINDDKKVAVLLSVIGSKAYGILRNLLAPASLGDQTYDALVSALKTHFEPQPIVIAERFHFIDGSREVMRLSLRTSLNSNGLPVIVIFGIVMKRP